MEEKTLRGALRPMKRRLDIPRATLFLLLAALLLFCSGEIAVAKVQTAFEPGRVLPGKAEPAGALEHLAVAQHQHRGRRTADAESG